MGVLEIIYPSWGKRADSATGREPGENPRRVIPRLSPKSGLGAEDNAPQGLSPRLLFQVKSNSLLRGKRADSAAGREPVKSPRGSSSSALPILLDTRSSFAYLQVPFVGV